MTILIAPNAFKNALDAQQVAEAISQGLAESRLRPNCLLQPIADGGDGMLAVLTGQGRGQILKVPVKGPLGQTVEARYGLLHEGSTAVIEMAEASGLRLISAEQRNPMRATTFGTGQLMLHALEQGVSTIMLGVGGSATIDAGLGMLMALGANPVDTQGKAIAEGAEGLLQLHQLDLSGLDARLRKVRIQVACDVTTPLTDSAIVYGPQKGATPSMVSQLTQALTDYGRLLEKISGKAILNSRGGGAAGGITASLNALLNAELLDGTAFLMQQTGFAGQLLQADLLITAEGALDQQTQYGKGPFYVAQEAKKQHKAVIMLAGSVPADFAQDDYPCYDAVFAIGAQPESLPDAIRHTRQNLVRSARQVGNLLALSSAAAYTS